MAQGLLWVRAFALLACIASVRQLAAYPDTDVVIVSNNDLNPSNPNRASALYLKSTFTCSEAYEACAQLQETILPPPNSTGLTAMNLSMALTSERHGAALDSSQEIWIASEDASSCSVFTPDYLYTDDYIGSASTANVDLSERLPVLCTNSAPLTRSNITSDTFRQIELSTPSAGVLTGYRDKFSWRFLGIKYAEPPIGEARFQPPTALQVPPGTVRSALEYGPVCAQPPDPDNGREWYDAEDCLQLNVFSPVVNSASVPDESAPKLPVMFFIHGGGLNTGDSGPIPFNMTTSGYVGPSISNIFDGTNMVSYGGVVLVTVNYRLTAFGWFNASNAALKDTLLALHWVQDNIESFGGDPTKVLIFGESAGGGMTRYLLGTNPAYTDGLFSAAILESDWPTSNRFYSRERSLEVSLTLAKALNCASSSSTQFDEPMALCVRNLSTEEIVATSYNLGISWEIVVDGDYVLADIATSIKDGVYARVPTIWATNECEYCFFIPTSIPPNSSASVFPESLSIWFNDTQAEEIMDVANTLFPYETAPSEDGISGTVLTLARLMTDWYLHCPMLYLSSLETNTTNPGNNYKVMFAVGLGSTITANPLTCPGQVCHADELYWVFATAETDNLYQPLTPSEVATTQEVIKRWTSLAWTGNPNYEGAVVEWPPYTGDNEVIINATATESIQPYRVAQCDFLQTELGFVFGQQ
ncbi:alpha/beta-hydrolase [Laetiporus sulphureus 93-53]|uniref:Carboxylic ester hydrolase n=1 Tax=Laetiporus sulphureus 93-53 TaxID=1314785 RepID=A0A165FB02_9APHY|nr:alpha/beta-hydrolase [Laetiporus sulphureus 93-53]KZT08692.1 alpha/beta-hydrolase [Laetiporus sulphureus 93-53]